MYKMPPMIVLAKIKWGQIPTVPVFFHRTCTLATGQYVVPVVVIHSFRTFLFTFYMSQNESNITVSVYFIFYVYWKIEAFLFTSSVQQVCKFTGYPDTKF